MTLFMHAGVLHNVLDDMANWQHILISVSYEDVTNRFHLWTKIYNQIISKKNMYGCTTD